jgi:hypothetical protein
MSDKEISRLLKELEAPAPENSANMKVAGAIFGSFLACTLGLTFPFVFSNSSLPYMATPGKKISRALEHLSKTKRPGTFVDLGSGDGEAVYQAAKLGYRAVGIELNSTLWALSSVRRLLFWSTAERERSEFIRGDFFSYNLKDANTVMMFGVVPLMKPLSEKIASECSSGIDVLSYRFALPLAHDEATSNLMRASIIYEEQEMRIYRCK